MTTRTGLAEPAEPLPQRLDGTGPDALKRVHGQANIQVRGERAGRSLTFECSWPDPAPRARSTIYRFRFPPQEHAITVGSTPRDPEKQASVGTVFSLDDEHGVLEIRRGSTQPAPTPTSLVPCDFVNPQPKPESLQRLARHVLEHSIEGPGEYRAARDLLKRSPPQFGTRLLLRRAGEAAEEAARRLVTAIDESYLAIQGPPGSGKSTVGAGENRQG